jgi:hypothetical protein
LPRGDVGRPEEFAIAGLVAGEKIVGDLLVLLLFRGLRDRCGNEDTVAPDNG